MDRRPRAGRAEKATQRRVKKKHANTRTALQRSGDLAFIAKWRILGLPFDALLQKLNAALAEAGRTRLSRAQFGYDLKDVDDAWRAERAENITNLRDKELAKLDVQEAELWEAWEKSKKAQGQRKVKQTQDGNVDPKGIFAGKQKTEKTFTDADSYGDPAIMAAILRLGERRDKICGYGAAVKVNHAGHDGGALPVGVGGSPIVRVIIAAAPEGEGQAPAA